MQSNDRPPRTWVRYTEGKPADGEVVEILVEIDTVESRAMRARAALDATTKAMRWLDPATGDPLSGFRRVTHWRRL